MTLEFFPFPFLVGILVLCLVLAVLGARKHSLSYLFCFSLFGIYLLLVAGVTLFPMPLPAGGNLIVTGREVSHILSQVNLIPLYYRDFKYLDPVFVFVREIVANIILTMPFGFGLSFVTRVRAKQLPFLALAAGIGIETTQLILCLAVQSSYRGVDINDALVNALGVLAGYELFKVFCRVYVSMTRRFKKEPKGLFAYLLRVSQNSMIA